MLEIKKDSKEHKINVYGEELTICEPSYKQSREYGKKVEGLSDAEQGDALIEFLDKLGLPKKYSEDFTSEQIQAVCGILMPSKKK